MIKLSFIGLYLLTSSIAYADCKYYDGTKTTTIAEGASVSLRSSGKSLENMKIQDQDGLGTCYANTTSTILKSVLPGHPDISYTHAAIMNTTRGWSENWNNPNKKYLKADDKEANFADGGWVCETVAGLKKAGGACPKNLSSTESTQLWDSDTQSRLFHGLSAYFDNMNLIKNDPSKFAQLKDDLSFAVETIKIQNAALVAQCEERKNIKFPVYSAVKDLFENTFFDDMNNPTKCSQLKAEALKKFLTPESIINKDRLSIVPNADVLKIFSNMIESDPVLAKDLEIFITIPNVSIFDYPALITELGKKINVSLLTLIPDEEIKKECTDVLPDQSVYTSDSAASNFAYFVRRNTMDVCKDILKSDDLSNLLNPVTNSNSCLAPTNFEMILEALKPLMEMKTSIDEKLLPTLLNPDNRYANQIVKAIMPGCLDQAKLIPLNNISCAGFSLCDGGFGDNNTYTGPPGGCYSFDNAKKLLRTKTLMGITQGRALGIDVCTSFMSNEDLKTNFCNSVLPGGEKHGFHEMSLTGYRCKGDKIEYEIVNSWGANCTDNKNIECQQDEFNNPVGPFWVKEDALVDSTVGVTSILANKK
jgi:hypothetical protein